MNWFQFNLNSFLWVFIVLNVANVVIQTVKSIATINGGKMYASIVNAVAYGLYTVVVVYMSADGLGLFWKAVIIGIANFIGVYAVKWFEEKTRKDKLWKVECTVTAEHAQECVRTLASKGIPHNYIEVGKFVIINCYCATQADSIAVKAFMDLYHAKYFVSESKTL